MNIIETPEDRFDDLLDYNFEANYLDVGDGLQMHYLDEGNPLAKESILLMHGEPSWSYLYRHMIPILVDAGYRVLAPDLIGFGKSSKPTSTADYTYARHIEWTYKWLEAISPGGLTLFAQDWGGLIGLRLVDLTPDSFARICLSNTGLPTGDQKPPEAFLKWQQFSQKADPFPFEMVMQGATERVLSSAELAAYMAPFPSREHTAGARIFPTLVPTSPDDVESDNNRKAWKETFMNWEKPLLTLFGDKDPVTKGGEAPWKKLVPGAQGQNHKIIEGGGHFIQEDKSELLARYLIEFISVNAS